MSRRIDVHAGHDRKQPEAVARTIIEDVGHELGLSGVTPREYLPLDRAVFTLENMSYGQLIAFEPRNFVDVPFPAVQLAGAAMTLYTAVKERGYSGWSTDSMIAMSLVAGELKKLCQSVPNARAFIHKSLMNEEIPPLYRTVSRSTARQTSKKKKSGYVYVLRSPTGAYKIGRTNNPHNRLRTFSVKLPFEVEYEVVIKAVDMFDLEAELHDRYAERALNGEWFALTDGDLAELRAMGGAS